MSSESNLAPHISVKQALAGQLNDESDVTVKGWVRSRRDSKGGFSFISVNDGSCFGDLQIVADNTLENYTSEILQITAGCSIIIQGKLIA